MAVPTRKNRQKLQKFFICKWWTLEKNFTEQKVFKIDQGIRCNFLQNFLRRFYIFQQNLAILYYMYTFFTTFNK